MMKIEQRTLRLVGALGVLTALAASSVFAGQASAVPRFTKSGAVSEPVITRKVDPVYPEEARKAKVMGIVVMEASVGVDGKVTEVEVVKSAADVLNQAALAAVRQWEYQPAKDRKGQPVAVRITLTVNFRLQ